MGPAAFKVLTACSWSWSSPERLAVQEGCWGPRGERTRQLAARCSEGGIRTVVARIPLRRLPGVRMPGAWGSQPCRRGLSCAGALRAWGAILLAAVFHLCGVAALPQQRRGSSAAAAGAEGSVETRSLSEAARLEEELSQALLHSFGRGGLFTALQSDRRDSCRCAGCKHVRCMLRRAAVRCFRVLIGCGRAAVAGGSEWWARTRSRIQASSHLGASHFPVCGV